MGFSQPSQPAIQSVWHGQPKIYKVIFCRRVLDKDFEQLLCIFLQMLKDAYCRHKCSRFGDTLHSTHHRRILPSIAKRAVCSSFHIWPKYQSPWKRKSKSIYRFYHHVSISILVQLTRNLDPFWVYKMVMHQPKPKNKVSFSPLNSAEFVWPDRHVKWNIRQDSHEQVSHSSTILFLHFCLKTTKCLLLGMIMLKLYCNII